MAQTAVQNSNTISFGSGKLEVSAYGGGGYINLGAVRNIVFDETFIKTDILSDNAGVIKTRVSEHKASLAADLMEIDMDNLYLIRGGIDSLTPVAGAPVVGHSELILSGAWLFNKFIELPHQNSAGTLITVTSVTASTNGLLVVAVDYDNVLVGTKTGIMVKDSTLVTTESQNLTIIYTYTPAVSHTLSSGGKYTITPIAVKVTNTDETAKTCIIELYKATNEQGITINFQPDESGDPNVIPIKITGNTDTARTAGDQLFIISSSQL